MKKTVFLIFASLLVITLFLVSCDNESQGNNANENHTHSFSMWATTTMPSCTTAGTQTRTCNSCGFMEYSPIPALGHTEVGDEAVEATCTTDGKTSGSHCSVCNEIFVKQNTIPASGHTYDNGEIVTNATCMGDGTKKYTCTIATCGHSYSEAYSLPTFTASELYEQSVKYVGEIVTYDKSGYEYSLGTGFVISSDGKIVTNYHVIEGAYSATICINGTTYKITSVLAYDSTIDLAVVKINATGLTAAKICKNPVKVGETVYAIGSSRGMTNTYSQGIITYADRIVDGVSHVQHDASITHGNSGGPLINAYGEVIGINTWGISDSQNLNFAVFTDELDNLVYGTPLTLAEFYTKECDVFEKLKNYIVDFGTYDYEDRYYYVKLGSTYSSDYADEYQRMAYYYVDDDFITLDFIVNDGDYWLYISIDPDVDGIYDWDMFDDNGYEMGGVLYASTYDSDTLVGYSYNNLPTASLRSSYRNLASTMVEGLCMWMDDDLAHLNITAEDLGFYYF